MEAASTCPKCSFAGNEMFEICPRCGIVVKKYHETMAIREKIEAERSEKRKKEDQEAAAMTERREDDRRWFEGLKATKEREKQEADKKNHQMRLWGRGVTGGSAFFGIILLVIGLFMEPGSEGMDTVNLYRLHIKQMFYYFAGVFFLIASINAGVHKVLHALHDILAALRTGGSPGIRTAGSPFEVQSQQPRS